MHSLTPGWRGFAFAAATIPALVYFGLVLGTRVDAPVLDDFDSVLRFAIEASDGPTFLARWAALVEPHVDHRIVLTRLAVAAQLLAFGRVDFAWLSLFGNALAALAFLALVIRREGRGTQAGALALVSASLIWFQPQAYDMLHWPTASIASFGVLAFATLAFACMSSDRWAHWAAAWLCAVAATWTQGNGVVVWPSVLGMLLLGSRIRLAAGWTLAAIPPLLIYAITYRGHSDGAAQLLDLTRGIEVVAHMLHLLGALVAPLGTNVAIILGFSFIVGFAVLTLLAKGRMDPRVLGLFLFCLGTVAGNAVLRAGLGADYALSQPRYRASSVLMLLALHLGLADVMRGRRGERAVQWGVLALAIVFSVSTFARYGGEVESRSRSAARGIVRWTLTGEGLSHPDPSRASELLRIAGDRGIYRARPPALREFLDVPVAVEIPAEPLGRIQGRIARVAANADWVLVEGRIARVGAESTTNSVFVVVEGEGGSAAMTSQLAVGPSPTRAFRSVFARPAFGAEPSISLLIGDPTPLAFAKTGRVIPPIATHPERP